MNQMNLPHWRVIPIASLLALAAGTACAQTDFPSKPIRLIVGFTAGGISDVLARAIGARLAAGLGQQVVVDNRAGAGTTIASELVAKSLPDGYTLFMQDITTHAINASLYRKLPYDSVKDFTPISLVAWTPLVLVVHPSVPVKTVKELIALAKARPGQVVYASSGNGTILHLSMETVKAMAKVDMVHVPYKGSSQVVQGLLAGEVAVSFSTMPPALPHVQSGRIRALGVTSGERIPAVREIPTLNEAGLPGFNIVLYSGVLGPAAMPRPILTRLNSEIVKAVNSPEIKAIYANIAAEPLTNTPEQFSAHIASEMVKLGNAVKAANAHVD
jgi:tripartite-type tricarboxylate transporter receptor subunit TctC